MLLDLTESYSVYAGLLPKGGVWLEPDGQQGSDVWARVLCAARSAQPSKATSRTSCLSNT